MARLKVCFSLILLYVFCYAEGAKLNVPRVLIPLFNTIQVNFTLEVSEGGCYRWSTSREDVVLVKPLFNANGCSSSARVTSAARLSHRNTAIILAEDVHANQILRCDVIVDRISKLDVITTTRELYVEEAPEAFDIVAYDNQGNEFTTLEGVDFHWTVVSSLKDSEVIRIMKFVDSSYKASESLKGLEARGLRGHTALLEGVRTGSAKVIMRLSQNEYSDVNSVEVVLRVVANLLLVPSEASILEGDSVHFKIVQVKEGRLIELTPSPQYSLEIEHSDIALLHPKTGIATGTTHGQTRIFLRDAGADIDPTDFRPPEAILRVGTARRLQLAGRPIPPSKPWALERGHTFSIHVLMLDSEDRFMHIGPQTQIKVTLNNNHFQVLGRTDNGSVVDGLATKSGRVEITATLLSVAGKNIYPKISTSGDMYIYESIELFPSNVVLDISSIRPEFQMTATGGDGSYSWSREGSAIAVDRQGRLTGLEIGNAIVIASLPNNPHINASANVRVTEAIEMDVVWTDGEASIGSSISLHIALYTHIDGVEGMAPITSCDNTPFDVRSVEGASFEYTPQAYRTYPNENKNGDACTILHVTCTEVGSITANVVRGNLHSRVTLSCHRPLTREYPSAQHQALILAVGSSANVIYSGGPASWSNDLEPVHNVTVSDDEIASAALYRHTAFMIDYSYVYTVTCLKLGHTEMLVKILRRDGAALLAIAKLSIQCNSPHALRITLRQPADSNCPITHPSQVRVLSSSTPLTLQISVADVKGNTFHNASSLKIKWTSLPGILAQDQLTSDVMLTQLDDHFTPIPVVGYHYRSIRVSESDLSSNGGSGEVIGEIIGYLNNVLKVAGASRTPQLTETPRGTITLRSVRALQVSQDKVMMYNFLSNEASISIYHGSGHIDVHVSPSGIVKYQLDNSGQILKFQPLLEGVVTVILKDKCVSSPTVSFQVYVLSAGSIQSDLPPLIEKGTTVECRAYLVDKLGSPFPKNVVGAPNITAVTPDSKETLKVVPVSDKLNNNIFRVTGLKEGEDRVKFATMTLFSIANTRVFPQLRIIPESSILLKGSSISLTTVGGPPPPATVSFHHPLETQHANILKVHSNGVLDALGLGQSKVEAHVEMGGVSYGHAFASVRVINLEGVSIHAPTASLLVGNTMPLWATGISEGIGPMELGSQPLLHFTWSVVGDGGAVINDVLESTNIEIEDKDRVSVRLRAVQPGRVKVHLNVTIDRLNSFIGKTSTWTATLDLLLVDPLQLISPPQRTSSLLLAPNSNTRLETNYRPDRVTYSIIDEDNESDLPLVTVSPTGVLRSHSALGRAVLVITGTDGQLEIPQHLTIAVEVVPISYTMLEVSSSLDFSGLQALPQGLHLNVIGHRYDSLGRSIAGAATNLGSLASRSDVVLVKSHLNDSLEIVLSEAGRSMFKLIDTSSEYSDYVLLKVSPAIQPAQLVATVGDCWCSRSGVSKASWSSSDVKCLKVSDGGLVQVLADSPAPVRVYLNAPNLQSSSIVQIKHADKITFLNNEIEHVFTDEKPYTIPLVVYNHEEGNKHSNVLTSDIDCFSQELTSFPFTCEIKNNGSISSQISVEPVLNLETRSYGCQLTWTPTTSIQSEWVSSDSKNDHSTETASTTKITVIAKLNRHIHAEIQTRGVRAAQPTAEVLHLSPAPALAAQLDIIGPVEVLKQIKIEPEKGVLTVEGPEKVSDIMLRYIVSGSKSYRKNNIMLSSHVRIISQLTHQNKEIIVNFGSSGAGDQCARGGATPLSLLFEDNLYILSLVVALFAIVGITIYVLISFNHGSTGIIRTGHIAQRQPVQDTQTLNNSSFSSRSPHSMSPQISPISRYQPITALPRHNESTVYGDPSYLPSSTRNRNRTMM